MLLQDAAEIAYKAWCRQHFIGHTPEDYRWERLNENLQSAWRSAVLAAVSATCMGWEDMFEDITDLEYSRFRRPLDNSDLNELLDQAGKGPQREDPMNWLLKSARTKPLEEIQLADVPRGLDPEDIALPKVLQGNVPMADFLETISQGCLPSSDPDKRD